ncbi:ATP-binding protein [Pseudomonas sp. FW215-R2]|nr:ATP-binding protein [Pseudomonas sp. FW215-R2]PMX09167.1 ATP-binding protein [Pseudomonas sp. FW215-L1]PMX21571.1 ATP-binding protein [Pseudomonas sp. FW215-E1]PNA22780.1 ATP-binding protein [Pseudomonas sp. FW215-R4]
MRHMNNPPDASALMTSARSFGNYDLSSALADIVDNSIKAKAHSIDIKCIRKGDGPEVRILDDGSGMTTVELHKAMRPASSNPDEARAHDDLGRFGWGMKSASLSQCRHLTVITRQDGVLTGASWNLDDIADWKMGILELDEIEAQVDHRLLERDGTEIIWSRCDRLSEYGQVGGKGFNDLVAHAQKQLSLIFHRYLSGEEGLRKLRIGFNGSALKPIDPFLRNHAATQAQPKETLNLDGQPIEMQSFILPHYSKLSCGEHDQLSGEEGFVRNQGFYVYRQHRLIIHGTWFRLVRHGELSQLVRIAVNIPNSLDAIWKITLDKADAQLPSGLKSRLKDIVVGLKSRSGKVFQSRGGLVREGERKTSVWAKYVRNGEVRYYVNREHPLIAGMLEDEDRDRGKAFAAALGIIEDCFPIVSIGEDYSSRPEMMSQGVLDKERFLDKLETALPSLLLRTAGDMKALRELLASTEPWASQADLVVKHLKDKRW